MIKAYVVGITNHYEGEDIEVRYTIYKDQELLTQKSVFMTYKKPLIVTHVALMALLKQLRKYSSDDIVILVNDASLVQQLSGTSQTKKEEVLSMARKVKQELNRFFGDTVVIEDVSTDRAKIKEWNDELRF